uniref:golgin subfamily A member 5 n=1 Tax=Ciona intestinalis TaxID=7719 RepID=UPI000180BFBA|nr:golgin subfamily A member 5 [Ciona intestinalis]|eukprot:XP_026689699.1 golgin subfamily A member 5 [Ciona intestinalis]
MSWLNNLAGKAESLLNNIDQSAAEVIHKTVEQEEEVGVTAPVEDQLNKSFPQSSHAAANAKSAQLSRAKAHTLRRAAEIGKKKKVEDALFDFLNSDEKITRSRSVPVTPRITKSKSESGKLSSLSRSSSTADVDSKGSPNVPSTFEISRSSSFESINSKVMSKLNEEIGSAAAEQHETPSEGDAMTLPDSTASESEFEMVGSSAARSDRDSPSTSSIAESASMMQQPSNDIGMENRMLRTELASLHQELTQTSERSKKIREDLQQTNRDLRNQCEDLQEEIKVKHSQLSAISMKLSEVQQLYELEKENTKQLKVENERLFLDQSEGSGMHARAMEELRSRLQEAEDTLAQERNFRNDERQEALNQRSRIESETQKIVETLQKSEHDRQSEKRKLDDISTEIRSLKNNLSSSKQELADYKQKAARILQSKERVIASLKGSGENDLSSSTINSLEAEEAMQERDQAKDEINSLRIEISDLRSEMQEVEEQHQEDMSSMHQELSEYKKNFQIESSGRREADAEVSRLQEEIRRNEEDLIRSRSSNQARLRDKEVEVERLRNQLMVRSQSSPQESELESRLRQLTEAVIQKQTQVESLSSEKSSLIVQMERMEGQIKRLSQEGGRQVSLNMEDDVVRNRGNMSHIPEFGGGGLDQGMVGKVRKAASVLDKFSIRLGIFLKRYPPARLFVLIYMGLLHVWVMIVLLTYSPEIHGHDFLSEAKPG